jgi:hypothetical protein
VVASVHPWREVSWPLVYCNFIFLGRYQESWRVAGLLGYKGEKVEAEKRLVLLG